ncbi:unnamed protein product [Protopolystoma xenopodis]|uniref:GB1/RHD3-type G domain-containing protein n=1 Tax=Protopolystoma xenopodis TaxID=117903 RepID=A0A3S5ACH1_9PLAT|nr:unnamed protein product [Protopolystoma xenopodis]
MYIRQKQYKDDPDELYALCDDPLSYPVKLINEKLCLSDITKEHDLFLENSGFMVIGAIGTQGSGKSSVLNLLANQLHPDAGVYNDPFEVQTEYTILSCCSQTLGLDLYITQDRLILLDAQYPEYT